MDRLKILVLIREFANKFPKHKQKFDMITAIEKYADVEYWYEDGDIRDILKKIKMVPDFIFHYDISWANGLSPNITGLDQIDIPKGCYVMDVHYSPETRIRYFEDNKIDLIFSVTNQAFLSVFPQYKEKHRWMPFSINKEVVKDWGLEKDIDSLLMGQVYYEDKKNPPKRQPLRGRYKFREAVLERMKKVKGFVFHPHPGHRVQESENVIINEKFSKELNRSRIFFTCGGEYGGAVGKFFEALGSRTLLLAEPNKDILDLGFEDRRNFVACDETDFYDKAMYYLRNTKERERITDMGYNFVQTFHTNDARAQKFISDVQAFLNQKNNKKVFMHETSIIEDTAEIGEGTKIWHFSHIMQGCKIGKNCTIGQNVVIAPNVSIGNNVKIQNNVSVYTGVICEDDVFLGPSCVFTNVINPRSFIDRKNQFNMTLIKKGATIGANTTIVCGNIIGKYAFVGAGAVITKDVPDYAVVVGNPARLCGWMCSCGQKINFEKELAVCKSCEKKYCLKENIVTQLY